MSKQLACQKYIFKIHTSRLRKAKWNLTLPLSEARRNDELISLADSQVLRWLDELNGVTDAEARAREIKREIRHLRSQPNSVENKRSIRQLYTELDEIQFKPDYLCLVIDKNKDYYRACKGFTINGFQYERLLGTNGGIKNQTIVFIATRHAEEIKRRINNGRNMEQPLVPAKLEAYKALTCSASNPVSMPHGLLVVSDCETEFLDNIIYLNDEQDGEPVMEERKQYLIQLDESDGYGIMLPCLAERWSQELGLSYTVSGLNSRMAWTKGMVYTFDFRDFAEKVAGKYIVKDAWGNDVDVREVELILTTSMLKLWDAYESCDDYLRCCAENHYTFGVTKTCPKELETEHNLNYQFIQGINMSDDDIEELIKPTLDEINNALHDDVASTILFLKGMGLNERNVWRQENDYAKAIMIEPKILDDPYVQDKIYRLIKGRITKAKVGVLKVHGNYSMVCGDPYALCQHIFGLPVTGLLKAEEIYNGYWVEQESDDLVCFRAPMSCPSNIRKVHINRSAEARYWYQYMTTCTLFSAWSTECIALNGADKDGDLVMITNNPVIVNRMEELPALMCVQRKAAKKVPTEEDTIKSNIDSFGDDIGMTTNWITSMYDVQAKYPKGSREYKEITYRIMCGQLYQQNTIRDLWPYAAMCK